MTDRSARRLAWALFGVVVLELAAAVVFEVLLAQETDKAGITLGDLGFLLSFILFPFIGLLVASRRPGNALGWLMLAIGIFAFEPISSYGEYAIATGRPGGALAVAIMQWTWVPSVGLAGTFLLLLFPDGHLPSPRWRWFAWGLGVALTILFFAILLGPGPMEESPVPARNPLGIESIGLFLDGAQILLLVIPIGALASLASLVLRFRRSTGIERLQLRWLLTAAAIVAILYSVAMVASLGGTWGGEGETTWLTWLQDIVIVSFALIPLAIGVSVLRYRLFDIDLIINRTLVYSALTVGVAVLYGLVVGALGVLFQAANNLLLSLLATGLAAILVQPMREGLQRLVNRLMQAGLIEDATKLWWDIRPSARYPTLERS